MTALIFALRALMRLVTGALLCTRFIRQEVAGDIGPRLRRIQVQLDALEVEVGLVLGTRYAEVSAHRSEDPRKTLRRSLRNSQGDGSLAAVGAAASDPEYPLVMGEIARAQHDAG